jgi:CheY-like chemotaxis protein
MTQERGVEHELARTRVEGGPLVLIVDDDRDSRETARMVLEEEGYTVDVAADGHAALNRLRSAPSPTLLLVDLMMPVMDGSAFLSALEASAELSCIPVVIMTASGPDPWTSGLRYPVLRKPFDLDELLGIVTVCSPRLWDEEHGTEETSLPSSDRGGKLSSGDDTPRVRCIACDRIASTRCVACGESFCRRCIDAGPDGRCAKCWRAAHP